MLVDRRRFFKTLLGAGAGLWVPEKTYFFLGGYPQIDFSDPTFSELIEAGDRYHNSIYPDLPHPWFRVDPKPIVFLDD